MAKIFGILIFVVGLWAATEYAAGTFPFPGTQNQADKPNTAAAAGAKVSDAYEAGNERRDAMLPE